ncbi:restriction endonuclease subunit S [Porphyromonas somerae]|uniref:restriction endonuclease subunit S n=1 Tax=Porphyromonas somerae TaxID=322095 RepID=UPI001FCAEE75|nr:restriction endonuclease subunit S [Porphyromonas somerae]BDE82036.1 type I restriction endonuclease subunit S [Porphyromonas somerae]
MTGQQLKNSILQWAIQGKLVPQDPTDEPASELLERIRTEKAQLIKEGKLKKGQPTSHIYRDDEGYYYEKVGSKDPVCINHEIPFDLPSGWEWCRLSDIGITMTGKTPPRGCPEFFGDYIPFLGPANISDDKIISVTQGLSKKGMEVANVVPPFTVMQVCIGGSIGKCAIAYEEVTFNQQINSITPVICDVGYVYLGMMSDFFRRQMVVKSTGTATPIINRSNWETILFPLPPLEEQKRIVARIEELMPLVEQYDKAHSELTRLNDQLPEQLKKSILQEAIQGKLVPQGPTDEPASVLLERIRTEKAQLIKEGKMKKGQPTSHIYRDDEGSYYEKVGTKDPVCINHEIPFDLPSGWEWCRGKTLFIPMQNTTPEGEIIYVDINSVSNKTNSIECPKMISAKDAPSRARRKLHVNDILFSMVRPYLRNVALVKEPYGDAIASTGFYVITPSVALFPRYVFYMVLSPYVIDGLNYYMKGENSPSINNGHVEGFLFPLPPLEEQKRIVARIEELMPRIDKLR